jgi:hypothetical protein
MSLQLNNQNKQTTIIVFIILQLTTLENPILFRRVVYWNDPFLHKFIRQCYVYVMRNLNDSISMIEKLRIFLEKQFSVWIDTSVRLLEEI